jgi:putative DNA primase/helicase
MTSGNVALSSAEIHDLAMIRRGGPVSHLGEATTERGKAVFAAIRGATAGDSIRALDRWIAEQDDRDAIVAAILAVDPEASESASESTDSATGGDGARSGPKGFKPVVEVFSDLKPTRVKWLWDRRIPRGKLTLICGDPGLGKSTAMIDIAARLTVGRDLPDDDTTHSPCSVLFLSAEDDPEDTTLPRFMAAGGDTKRAMVLTAVRERVQSDNGKEVDLPLSLDIHLGAIEEAITTHQVALLIIDPLTAFLGDTNSFTDADVRSVLMPLSKLAERLDVAIVLIMHLNKSTTQAAIYRPGGSIAFVAAARAAHVIADDPEDFTGRTRLFLPLKGNLSVRASGLRFLLDSHLVFDSNQRPIPTSKV